MQAIRTKYHGFTNFKPSRVTATAEAGKITLSWEHGFDVEDNHRRAALALVRKLGWDKECYQPLVTGGFPDSYVHVFPSKYDATVTLSREQQEKDAALIASLPKK